MGLADDDRTGVDQALDCRRVPLGDVVDVESRAVRRADAGGVEEVLDGERPSGERPGGFAWLAWLDERDESVVGVDAHARRAS
jgi:hypothetical protein